MQNARAHIGKLAKLGVGDYADALGILDNSRVSNQKSRNVRPVLVKRSSDSLCDNRAREIRTAARKRLNRTVGHCAVKSGDNGSGFSLENSAEASVCDISVKLSVVVEEDTICRVNELIIEILRENNSVQILAARSRVVTVCALAEILTDFDVLVLERQIERQILDNPVKALSHGHKSLREILACEHPLVALIQQIRNLCIIGKALSGRARHNIAALLVAFDNLGNLLKLSRICKRASSKLYNLAHKNTSL